MKGSSLNEIDSRCHDLEPPIKTRAVRMLKLVVVGDAVGLNVRIRQKFDSEEEYLIRRETEDRSGRRAGRGRRAGPTCGQSPQLPHRDIWIVR